MQMSSLFLLVLLQTHNQISLFPSKPFSILYSASYWKNDRRFSPDRLFKFATISSLIISGYSFKINNAAIFRYLSFSFKNLIALE